MKISTRKLLIPIISVLLAACGGGEQPIDGQTGALRGKLSDMETSQPVAPTTTTLQRQPSIEFDALPLPYRNADYDRGRRTFKLCQSCHTVRESGQNLVGPNLYGIFGRKVGTAEDYSYSTAASEAGFTWTPKKLNEWLTSPRNFLPGNKMSFAGVRKPQDRLAVIAYIMTETGYQRPDE